MFLPFFVHRVIWFHKAAGLSYVMIGGGLGLGIFVLAIATFLKHG